MKVRLLLSFLTIYMCRVEPTYIKNLYKAFRLVGKLDPESLEAFFIMTGIYKITNPKGKVYVGQSRNIEQRLDSYRWNKAKGQPKLHYSIRKYGWDRHTFEVVEECKEEELSVRERHWQVHYKVVEEGLNLLMVNPEHKTPAYHPDLYKYREKKRTGEYKVCSHCNEDMYVTPSRLERNKKGKFICTKCYKAGHRIIYRIETQCGYCGKELEVEERVFSQSSNHYCNRQCANATKRKS